MYIAQDELNLLVTITDQHLELDGYPAVYICKMWVLEWKQNCDATHKIYFPVVSKDTLLRTDGTVDESKTEIGRYDFRVEIRRVKQPGGISGCF